MFPVALFLLAFFCVSLFQSHWQAAFFVHALPTPRQLPDVNSVASRGTPRQNSVFLDAHNAVRNRHSAQALRWSGDLANKAGFWADRCQLEHSGGVLSPSPYGENIAAGTGRFTINDAVSTFIDDGAQYNSSNPSYLRFTQVVWKSTTELGCAVSECRNLFGPDSGTSIITVCLYNPPGNVVGKANENVQI